MQSLRESNSTNLQWVRVCITGKSPQTIGRELSRGIAGLAGVGPNRRCAKQTVYSKQKGVSKTYRGVRPTEMKKRQSPEQAGG